MSGILLKIGENSNTSIMEFAVDREDEIALLPTTEKSGSGIFNRNKYAPIGSTCIVGNEGGDLLLYMLFSFGWKKL